MNKKIVLSILTITAGIFMILSCRRDVEERPLFASAEYFAPAVIEQNGELTIRGFVLSGSTVTIDGKVAPVIKVITSDSTDDQRTILVVKVPSELGVGKYKVEVTYKDKGSFTFEAPLIISTTPSTVKELLIGDFDGGGIRPAVASSDFTNGQWGGESSANSIIGIKSVDGLVTSSPAGGNFAFARVDGSGILPNTFGYVAAINTRNEIQNNFIASWPKNFVEYPNSTLTIEEGDQIADFRVNFYINMNGNIHSQLRVFLGNSDLGNAFKYAHNIFSKSTTKAVSNKKTKLSSDEGWIHVSIPFTDFDCNFGYGGGGCDETYDLDDLRSFNQISFSISDDYNNNYGSCCSGSKTDCCVTAIKDPVSIYIDHVVISKGGESVDYGN